MTDLTFMLLLFHEDFRKRRYFSIPAQLDIQNVIFRIQRLFVIGYIVQDERFTTDKNGGMLRSREMKQKLYPI